MKLPKKKYNKLTRTVKYEFRDWKFSMGTWPAELKTSTKPRNHSAKDTLQWNLKTLETKTLTIIEWGK